MYNVPIMVISLLLLCRVKEGGCFDNLLPPYGESWVEVNAVLRSV